MEAHILYGLCIFGSLILGITLTPLAIRLANAMGLVDRPGVRKIHSTPVPRIGGIAIAAAMLIPFLLSVVFSHRHPLAADADRGAVVTLILAGACVLILGLIDDIGGVPAQFKLIVLLGSASIFCASGG